MVINTKNQYNTVLKEIDVLLELSFLDTFQTIKLKILIKDLVLQSVYIGGNQICIQERI